MRVAPHSKKTKKHDRRSQGGLGGVGGDQERGKGQEEGAS